MSHFLFILGSKVLSILLIREENLGGIHGIKVSRDASSISHLLFADDLLIFSRANAREANRLSATLEVYAKISGQKVNLAKSALYCSKNTHPVVVEELCRILHVKKLGMDSKYLGLTLFVGRSKKKAFIDVKEKVLTKIAGWKMRTLSQAGRTTLIKAVATAMPLCCMSTFLLPRGWYEDIDRLLKNFWWGFPAQKSHNFTPKA